MALLLITHLELNTPNEKTEPLTHSPLCCGRKRRG
jgi:hypothetical protein